MKRLYHLLAVAAVTLLVPIAASTPAAAADFVCEVGFTGPDSNNMCVSKQTYTCTIENNNIITVVDSTEQEAASGEADVDGNGSGGDAVSGTVSNSSGATYNFTITNGTSEEEGRVCTALKVVPAKPEVPVTPETPEAPKTPVTPGRGEASAPVRPAQSVTPAALPVTSGSNAPAVVVLTSGTIVTAAIAYAYRRFLS